jgi:hypothetical protein
VKPPPDGTGGGRDEPGRVRLDRNVCARQLGRLLPTPRGPRHQRIDAFGLAVEIRAVVADLDYLLTGDRSDELRELWAEEGVA